MVAKELFCRFAMNWVLMLGGLGIITVAATTSSPAHRLTVPVIVERIDHPGVFATGLTRADFEVAVNGQLRAIEQVSSGGGAAILLLVDLSFSATGVAARDGIPWGGIGHDFAGLVQGIDRALLPNLRRDDRLVIGAFTGSHVWFSTATSDRAAQSAAVKSVLDLKAVNAADWFGPSPIWDVTARGAEMLADYPGVRALILVTDGNATGNRLGASEAAEAAIARTVQLHPLYEKVVLSPKSPPLPFATGDGHLRRLAERTGGLFRIDERHTQTSWRQPVPPFAEIVDAIHKTYVLTVKLQEDDEAGKALIVRVKQPWLRVHAPSSFGVGSAVR